MPRKSLSNARPKTPWYLYIGIAGIVGKMLIYLTSEPSQSPSEEQMSTSTAWIIFAIILLLIYVISLYLAYEFGYTRGKTYVARRDSGKPLVWRSRKWKYEITFPFDWGPLKRDDPSIRSKGADIYCAHPLGYSTVVFAYRKIEAMSLAALSRNLLDRIGKMVNDIQILYEREYSKNGDAYRRVVFKADGFIHHYTLIFHKNRHFAISSHAEEKFYPTARADFERIAQSIRFFD